MFERITAINSFLLIFIGYFVCGDHPEVLRHRGKVWLDANHHCHRRCRSHTFLLHRTLLLLVLQVRYQRSQKNT